MWAGVALEWVRGNWSSGAGGGAGPGGVPEGEETGSGSGSGSGSGYGGAEWPEGGAMLSAIWETEGLQTVGIVVLVFASIKLLHVLGLISFSEGKGKKKNTSNSQRKRHSVSLFYRNDCFFTHSSEFCVTTSKPLKLFKTAIRKLGRLMEVSNANAEVIEINGLF